MGASMRSSVADQNLAAVADKHRRRSVLEGLKVAAGLGLAFPLIGALALVTLPARAWVISVAGGLAWIVCAAFVLFFFRDAHPRPPAQPGLILSPAHGTIDYIDTAM